MSIAIRPATVTYRPDMREMFAIYLELCEIVFCFAVAILREFVSLTVRTVSFIQAWQSWHWQCLIGPVDMGFDLQQDWDDLEVVWINYCVNSRGFSVYYCRRSGWVRMSW